MWRSALRYSAVGLEMGVAVAVGYGAGWWLDGKFGTKPTLSFIGLLLGIAAGFFTLVRVARELNRLSDSDSDSDSDSNSDEVNEDT